MRNEPGTLLILRRPLILIQEVKEGYYDDGRINWWRTPSELFSKGDHFLLLEIKQAKENGPKRQKIIRLLKNTNVFRAELSNRAINTLFEIAPDYQESLEKTIPTTKLRVTRRIKMRIPKAKNIPNDFSLLATAKIEKNIWLEEGDEVTVVGRISAFANPKGNGNEGRFSLLNGRNHVGVNKEMLRLRCPSKTGDIILHQLLTHWRINVSFEKIEE